MPAFLAEIAAHKRQEVELRKQARSLDDILSASSQLCVPKGRFVSQLKAKPLNIIAEIKPASPSAGTIKQDVNVDDVLAVYNHWACAISVLTDRKYFQGSLSLLSSVVKASPLPVLCKDFILDPYQIYEAREAGAEAVLLIVKMLSAGTLKELHDLCRKLNLAAVVEVQNEEEVASALDLNPEVILINNRDLDTFAIDMNTCMRLAPLIPDSVIKIAASGIEGRADIDRLRSQFSCFLIGSTLMKSPDMEATFRELVGRPSTSAESCRIKFCGITNVDDAIAAVKLNADYLGLIFAESSPRCVSLDTAVKIADTVSGRVKLVGVFKDQPGEYIESVAAKLGLDYVQYHGKESFALCKLSPAPLIKALELTADMAESDLDKYSSLADYLLFDRPKVKDKNQRDLGEPWLPWASDWLSKRKSQIPPFFFAGGLTPDNVGAVVAKLRPFAVDVASGVERAPGIKDHQLMRKFVEAVNSQAAHALVNVEK